MRRRNRLSNERAPMLDSRVCFEGVFFFGTNFLRSSSSVSCSSSSGLGKEGSSTFCLFFKLKQLSGYRKCGWMNFNIYCDVVQTWTRPLQVPSFHLGEVYLWLLPFPCASTNVVFTCSWCTVTAADRGSTLGDIEFRPQSLHQLLPTYSFEVCPSSTWLSTASTAISCSGCCGT